MAVSRYLIYVQAKLQQSSKVIVHMRHLYNHYKIYLLYLLLFIRIIKDNCFVMLPLVKNSNFTIFFFSNAADNTEDSQKRSLISFDVSCDDRLMACGTEYTGGDAFILFWDIRCGKSKIKEKGDNVVGGYWESHTDDITSLAFNPVRPNVLASGSTDGLINIFDLAQSSEDAALTYTLNTESSVVRELSHVQGEIRLREPMFCHVIRTTDSNSN